MAMLIDSMPSRSVRGRVAGALLVCLLVIANLIPKFELPAMEADGSRFTPPWVFCATTAYGWPFEALRFATKPPIDDSSCDTLPDLDPMAAGPDFGVCLAVLGLFAFARRRLTT